MNKVMIDVSIGKLIILRNIKKLMVLIHLITTKEVEDEVPFVVAARLDPFRVGAALEQDGSLSVIFNHAPPLEARRLARLPDRVNAGA